MKPHIRNIWDHGDRHAQRCAVIAALQLHDQPRTLVEIVSSTRLDINTVRHSLNTLMSEWIIEAIAPGQFVLATPAAAPMERAA